MQKLKWKHGEMSFPNLSIFLKYGGDDLLERISDTGSKTGFRFITFDYDSSTKNEELRKFCSAKQFKSWFSQKTDHNYS